jgi:hypothetical protein
MMNPDRPAPPGVWSAPTGKGSNGAASSSASGSDLTRATQRWPATSRKSHLLQASGAPSSNDDSEDLGSDESSEGDKCQPRTKRVRVNSASSDHSDSSSGSSAAAPKQSLVEPVQASDEAEPPPAAITAAMMAKRASLMFVLFALGPVASGLPKIAMPATMGFVEIAFEAIGKLCDKHGKALSKAYSNFDRVVGLGWLVADALGAQLIDRERAYTIGMKLRKLPGELKVNQLAVRKAASRAISKLEAADPRRLELRKKADDDEAQLACAEVEIDLPTTAPDPLARASGSRKRAVPKPEDSFASRDAAILAAQTAICRTERRLDEALLNVNAKNVLVARMWRRFRTAMGRKKKSFAQLKRCSFWLDAHEKAVRTQLYAELAQKDAMIRYLEAQIGQRDMFDDEEEAIRKDYQDLDMVES